MLEAYQAFADFEDIMVLIEEVFIAVADAAVGGTKLTYQGRDLDMSPPFR